MSLFALGSIDELLIDSGGFNGFDIPGYLQPVRILSDGSRGPHEVLQSSGVPARTASISGTLTPEDCVFIRRYDQSKELVTFWDGNDNSYNVRVMELQTKDFVDYWTFTATLYCTDEFAEPGS